MKSKGAIPQVSIVRQVPARKQIANQLRDSICSGDLAGGTRLPSTKELARIWQTNPATVHRALRTLVNEGLITRTMGRGGGTFVCEQRRKLEKIAVHTSWGVKSPFTPFQSAVFQHVCAVLQKRGFIPQVIMEAEPDDETVDFKSRLWEAVERGEVDAAVFLGYWQLLAKVMSGADIPISTLCPLAPQGAVNMDWLQFLDGAVQKLAVQGCQSVGLITPLEAQNSSSSDFFDGVVNSASRYGLQIQDRWICSMDEFGGIPMTHNQYGYRAFKRLWQSGSVPEGLVIEPDSVVHGTLLAMQESGLRVPEDLRLVLHCNESLPYACPYEATLGIISERRLAETLIDQIVRIYQGEDAPLIRIEFTWTEHRPEALPA